LADASQAWQSAIGSAFVGWAMAQAQAGADFGIAGAIAGATAVCAHHNHSCMP